jgi:hypothetical protein
MSRKSRLAAVAATATAVSLLLGGCDVLLGQVPIGADDPVTSSTPTASCNNGPYESVFSAFGSIHYTRTIADDLTLILDMYTDEKTHEWYADTEKDLSFVVKVVDSAAAEDDPFSKKRKTYMDEITIQANTVTKNGDTESLFDEDLDPIEATLDPEALHSNKYGLLVTSPKGGFQREHNTIAPATLPDTIGFNMDFVLTISDQSKLKSKEYDTRDYTISIPVAIFDEANKNTITSCATNGTLEPVDENAD